LLLKIGLQSLSPQPDDTSFDGWWARMNDMVGGQAQEGLNWVVILGLGCFGTTRIDVCLMLHGRSPDLNMLFS